MAWWAVVLVVGGVWIAAVTLWLIWAAARRAFRGLTETWPPREPAADADARLRQRVQVGFVRFSDGYSVAADGWGLHLAPNGLAVRLGAEAFSVPWAEVVDMGPAWTRWSPTRRLFLRRGEVRRQIVVPDWVLERAGEPERAA